MSSPISPGDVLELAKGVYKLYKRFRDAPKEMKQLGEQVQLVTALLRNSNEAIQRLDFLQTPEGKDLLDILYVHLREMKMVLRQIKDVGVQWKKAKANWMRRPPFILFTMRAIPGLQEDLERESRLVESIKTQAFQIGVPAALKQLQDMIASQKQKQRSITQDNEFTTTEQKRRVAYSVLSKSVHTAKSTSTADEKTQTLTALRQSGLANDEAQKLLDIFETEKKLKDAAASVAAKDGNAQAKDVKSARRVGSFSTAKVKPKIKVIAPKKPAVAQGVQDKERFSPESGQVNTKSKPVDNKAKPKVVVIKNNESDTDKGKSKEPDKPKPKTKVFIVKNDSSARLENDGGKPSKDSKPMDKNKDKDQKTKVAQALAPIRETDEAERTNGPKSRRKKKKTRQNSAGDDLSGKQNEEKKAKEVDPKAEQEEHTKRKAGKKQDEKRDDSNQAKDKPKQQNPPKAENNTGDPVNKAGPQAKQQKDVLAKYNDMQTDSGSTVAKLGQQDPQKQETKKKKKKKQEENLTDAQGQSSNQADTKTKKQPEGQANVGPKPDVKEKKDVGKKPKTKDQPAAATL